MDTNRNLYITTLSNVVEKYDHDGHKIGEMRYPELIFGDGIATDGSNNLIIADHADRVVIYDQKNFLIKKLWPIPLPNDVAVSANCRYLYVSSWGSAKALIYT